MEQMDNVVAHLSEIDAAAQRIMDQAAVRKREMDEQDDRERKRFDRELEEKTGDTLEGLKAELNEKAKMRLEELMKGNEHVLEKLEETYARQKDALAEELFRKVIEGC